jgi:hypothetical protein
VHDFPTGLRNAGASAQEMIDWYACDGLGFPFDDVYFRTIDVAAPATLVYRWLCQLRARRVPRSARPEFDRLQIGQRYLRDFRIVGFEPGVHVTVVMRGSAPARLLGDVAATFALRQDYAGTRLVVKELVRYPSGILGWLPRLVKPALDLLTLRLALGALAKRAERDYEEFVEHA